MRIEPEERDELLRPFTEFTALELEYFHVRESGIECSMSDLREDGEFWRIVLQFRNAMKPENPAGLDPTHGRLLTPEGVSKASELTYIQFRIDETKYAMAMGLDAWRYAQLHLSRGRLPFTGKPKTPWTFDMIGTVIARRGRGGAQFVEREIANGERRLASFRYRRAVERVFRDAKGNHA